MGTEVERELRFKTTMPIYHKVVAMVVVLLCDQGTQLTAAHTGMPLLPKTNSDPETKYQQQFYLRAEIKI